MQQHFQAIVTVLSLVNPLICGAMFAQIEAGQTSATRFADATKAALTVLVILVIAALVGAKVLQVFGVSLEAFSIAGGWRRAGLDRVLHAARQFSANPECG
jgi:multiple antibiotic resistance protein